SAFRLRRVQLPERAAWYKTPPTSRSDVDSAIDRPPRAQATATRRRPPIAVCGEPACADEAVQGSVAPPDRRSAAARCHYAAAPVDGADSFHGDAEDQRLAPPPSDDQFRPVPAPALPAAG